MAQEAGEVDCCLSVNLQKDKKLRALLLGQPWPAAWPSRMPEQLVSGHGTPATVNRTTGAFTRRR